MRWLLLLLPAVAALAADLPSIAKKTEGMQQLPGYFPLYWDAKAGKLWLEIPRLDSDVLYVSSLPAGLGSNDIGLDRGRLGAERLVRFERTGPKVLLVERNLSYRAESSDAFERKAVEDSFAQSVLWGFTAEAEDGGRTLVDATAFFLRDAVDVPGSIARSRQGAFRLDASRSALYLPRTKNFPKNTEVEATLTFTSDNPGPLVRSVAPAAESITIREHHSFVELPGDGFTPRAYDPRSGFFSTSYYDYATPVSEPVRKLFAPRHRLVRGKPIVYYLDRGAPEPIRSALLEGASWWEQAFAAAGYPGHFKVELLPEDADPMDCRYNVINWVHRSTRGWSYGSSVTDPRTGEIIKGHVTLGSLRVRQDYLIAEGLLSPYEAGKEPSKAMMEMALARLRQLSAHEVGHTLGLAHNYVASIMNRSSVMDYPHPLAALDGPGAPLLHNAYATGIGDWDKVAITWGYADSNAGVLDAAHKRGLYFIADADARPAGSAHPFAHLWDEGGHPVDQLKRVMAIRARALDRFGEASIRDGAPMTTLEDVLVPVYLGHRYQVEAAVKMVGGLNYRYALRGDGQMVTEPVAAEAQAQALDAVLSTITPVALTLPERIVKLIPPRVPGYPRTRETFRSRTGLTFDPVGAAEAAADLTLSLILNRERASRIAGQHARDARQPSLDSVLDRVIAATWSAATPPGLAGEVKKAVDTVALYRLMELMVDADAPQSVRSAARAKLERLRASLKGSADAHRAAAAAAIQTFFEDPKQIPLPKPLEAPPGMPI